MNKVGSDMPYSDIVSTLRHYGGKHQQRLVPLATIARSIGYSNADALFYLQKMEEEGIVELSLAADAGYAARLREIP